MIWVEQAGKLLHQHQWKDFHQNELLLGGWATKNLGFCQVGINICSSCLVESTKKALLFLVRWDVPYQVPPCTHCLTSAWQSRHKHSVLVDAKLPKQTHGNHGGGWLVLRVWRWCRGARGRRSHQQVMQGVLDWSYCWANCPKNGGNCPKVRGNCPKVGGSSGKWLIYQTQMQSSPNIIPIPLDCWIIKGLCSQMVIHRTVQYLPFLHWFWPESWNSRGFRLE